MFLFAGLGELENSSVIVLIKPYVDRGQAHTPIIHICVYLELVVYFFPFEAHFLSDHTYT